MFVSKQMNFDNENENLIILKEKVQTKKRFLNCTVWLAYLICSETFKCILLQI